MQLTKRVEQDLKTQYSSSSLKALSAEWWICVNEVLVIVCIIVFGDKAECEEITGREMNGMQSRWVISEIQVRNYVAMAKSEVNEPKKCSHIFFGITFSNCNNDEITFIIFQIP